jgi:ABC-type transport system substrate-binding protein
MIRRGSCRLFTIAALGLTAVLVPLTVSGAASAPVPVSDNAKTLNISLPGPFNGCTYLDSGAGDVTGAVLDLVRPSAFQTSSVGNLYGAGGPIASAELTSLAPETVQYTIAANQKWSNGAPFTANALVGWWLRARKLDSVQSDGYRSIRTMTVANHGLMVTAVFATPYADWNLLFRDVEALGSAKGCSLSDLVHRPSLGAYKVQSATAHRIVLVMNKSWPNDLSRFGRLVITDGDAIPSVKAVQFVNYTLSVNRAHLQALSSHPTVLSHIGSSSSIEEITFGSARPLTKRLGIREALSWSINRQSLLNQLWGSVTFSPSVAASALYSQGQSSYPGGGGNGPTAQTTTSTTTPSAATNGLPDCLACAVEVLRSMGYRRTALGWTTNGTNPLAIRIAVGPSGLDHSVAQYVEAQWSRLGIAVFAVKVSSDMAAAATAASNGADVAIFARPTSTAVSYAARSWSGPAFADTYPSGVRSASLTSLFKQGIGIFNPVTASSTWLGMDQVLMTAFWVRPLFTSPSLLEWSNTVANVLGSFSAPGLLDQEPNWSTATPASQN